MKVPSPRLVVTYNGRDITIDISRMLTELTYTDYIEGESDTSE